jgi:hypothetical protein
LTGHDNIPGRWHRSPLTTELLADPDLLARLHEQADNATTPQDRLALRLELDRAIRERTAWPREQDYTQIADDLEATGWLAPAAALRHLTGTDELIEATRRRWAERYVYRGGTVAELELERITEAGNIQFADAEPVPGIDGARYERGYITADAYAGHVVVVRGRGLDDLITFGDDADACERWVAGRGSLATAPFDPPRPVQDSRTWREEQLLAAMLTRPVVLARYRDQYPPGTFTTDSRYEIYTTMLTLAGIAHPVYPVQVADRLRTLQDRLPAEALSTYGGTGLPWLRCYLERLTATDVTPAAAETAAQVIAVQDTLVHERNEEPRLYNSLVADSPTSQRRLHPGTSPSAHRDTIPNQPGTPSRTPHIPPPEPGNRPGPAPRQ